MRICYGELEVLLSAFMPIAIPRENLASIEHLRSVDCARQLLPGEAPGSESGNHLLIRQSAPNKTQIHEEFVHIPWICF